MQDLYDELWGKHFHPGYKVNLNETGDKTFPDLEFAKGKKEQVFNILKVRSKLPCGMNQLLVCQEFEMIKHKLLETGIPVRNLNLDCKIASQPSSGKSFFLSYLLVLRILAGQPTIFRRNDSHYYLFDSNSHGSKTDANSLFDLSQDQKRVLWILTDGVLEGEGWNDKGHSWFGVLAVSPKNLRGSRKWVKDRNVGSRNMRKWEWDEIVAAFSLESSEPPTPCQISMLFTTFTCLGPIARTCLQSISLRDAKAYNRSLKMYLDKVDDEIDTFIVQGGFQTVDSSIHQHASHMIAIIDPSDDRLSCKAQITSRWIAHKVFEKAQIKSQLNCFELYKYLTHQDPLRSAAGWFFEGYTHDWFGKGGSFEADELLIKDNNTPPLKFKTNESKSLNYFMDANNLATQVRVEGGQGVEQDAIGKYFLPYNANFESVDGLVFSDLDTLILLQITIAKSHDIKLCRVKKLCKSLPATIKNIHIVFIIPEDYISEYLSIQSVPEASDVKPRATDLTINQFRLVLTEEIMQLMAVDGPFKVRDGGLVFG
ncbi:hypothetical protein L873DRAFT_1860351 [Choiromyces venosus 120613-1]|uniref:Uncharacterized protein n=1 Tax=Choiromyces venosus 120613-1 TaxID=1336337 RepID=A0A3N4JZI9_9PEZI|nr:hypothetical protein L873DRAFT_1860351 [Choiromyces venosus 120613-1]